MDGLSTGSRTLDILVQVGIVIALVALIVLAIRNYRNRD